MPKYYVMLVDRPRNQMRVPVKALMNPYQHGLAYCSGMPQFFGGTDSDDDPPASVLKQELAQESRRTLELMSDAAQSFFASRNMFFYWASEDGWQETPTAWGSARNEAEGEMDRIEIVDLARFQADWDDAEILVELVGQTHCQEAPAQGRVDFIASTTKLAFLALIRELQRLKREGQWA